MKFPSKFSVLEFSLRFWLQIHFPDIYISGFSLCLEFSLIDRMLLEEEEEERSFQ